MKNIIYLAFLTLSTSLASQIYQPGDLILGVGMGFGGERPNTVVLENAVGDNRLVNISNGYDLKLTPVSTSFSAQYAFSPLISGGVYFSPAVSVADVRGAFRDQNRVRGDFNSNSIPDERTLIHQERRILSTYYFGLKAEAHFGHYLNLPEDLKLDLYAGASIGRSFKRERVKRGEDILVTEFDVPFGNTEEELIKEYDPYSWNPEGSMDINVFAGARYYFTENLAATLELGLRGRYGHLGLTYLLAKAQ